MTEKEKYPEKSFISELMQDPDFKAWLWDSNIIDTNWEPLIMIHGSNEKFDKFNPDVIGSKSWRNRDPGFFGRWFYFTPHINLAKKYWSILYRCILRADKVLTFEDYHCNTRRFSPEKLPEEVKEDIIKRYSELEQQKPKPTKSQDIWPQAEWIWSWRNIWWGVEEEYDENILAEAFREVITEKWYQWVEWKNPVSWEYEYVIFNPDDIFTFEVDIWAYLDSYRAKVWSVL
jgi:hypothetical protein